MWAWSSRCRCTCSGTRTHPPGHVQALTSAANPRYRQLLRLAESGRARREQAQVLLEGAHLVCAYRERWGSRDMELVVKDSARSHPEVLRACAGASPLLLADALFDALVPVTTPLGVLACVPMPALPQPARPQCLLLLDGIQDPGNLGTLLRTGVAAGADAAWLSPACADAWSPRCLRGGMGAQLVLPLRVRAPLPTLLGDFAGSVISLEAGAAHTIYEADLRGACAFVLGGEGAGVSAALQALATQRLRIPMAAGMESLNVAAAAAVALFERSRQRLRPPAAAVPVAGPHPAP